MPLTIVVDLDGTPKTVPVPGGTTLSFTVRATGSRVHAWVTYELDPGISVWFQQGTILASSFQVDLGNVDPLDRRVDQDVQFNWGPGTAPPGRLFRVIAHVTEADGPSMPTETTLVIA